MCRYIRRRYLCAVSGTKVGLKHESREPRNRAARDQKGDLQYGTCPVKPYFRVERAINRKWLCAHCHSNGADPTKRLYKPGISDVAEEDDDGVPART